MISSLVPLALAAASDDPSPILAVASVVTIAVLVIGQIVLFVGALISIIASARYTGGGKVLWVILVFCLPLLGPLIWFAAGRRAAIRTDVP